MAHLSSERRDQEVRGELSRPVVCKEGSNQPDLARLSKKDQRRDAPPEIAKTRSAFSATSGSPNAGQLRKCRPGSLEASRSIRPAVVLRTEFPNVRFWESGGELYDDYARVDRARVNVRGLLEGRGLSALQRKGQACTTSARDDSGNGDGDGLNQPPGQQTAQCRRPRQLRIPRR